MNDIYTKVLLPGGFHVERVSRLPYLAEGEYDRPLYVLDDAIFVLSIKDSQRRCVTVPLLAHGLIQLTF